MPKDLKRKRTQLPNLLKNLSNIGTKTKRVWDELSPKKLTKWLSPRKKHKENSTQCRTYGYLLVSRSEIKEFLDWYMGIRENQQWNDNRAFRDLGTEGSDHGKRILSSRIRSEMLYWNVILVDKAGTRGKDTWI
ncbi:hypothetical protein C8R44DRAFT_753518 [Mycena epipterygia]|nr:hypothetical protein C8R44DRAFT_753518 [Mycena epipterygia]